MGSNDEGVGKDFRWEGPEFLRPLALVIVQNPNTEETELSYLLEELGFQVKHRFLQADEAIDYSEMRLEADVLNRLVLLHDMRSVPPNPATLESIRQAEALRLAVFQSCEPSLEIDGDKLEEANMAVICSVNSLSSSEVLNFYKSFRSSEGNRALEEISSKFHLFGMKKLTLQLCVCSAWETWRSKRVEEKAYVPWPFLAYLFLLFLGCLVSAYLSYFVYSSPAFQAAFGYGLDEATIRQSLQENQSFLQRVSYSTGDEAAPLQVDGFFDKRPKFGFVVESLRALIFIAAFFVVSFLVYNPFRKSFGEARPRDERGFLKSLKAQIRKKEIKRLELTLFIAGVLAIVVGTSCYICRSAPISLAKENPLWNLSVSFSSSENKEVHWYLAKERSIWLNADRPSKIEEGNDVTSIEFLPWDKASESEGRGPQQIWGKRFEDHVLSHSSSMVRGSEFWYELYERPYRFYWGYALIMFSLVAWPMLFVVVRGVSKSLQEIQQALALTDAYIGARTSPEKVVEIFSWAARYVRQEIHKALFVVLLLAGAGLYEARLGYYTLATFALFLTILSLFLILAAFGITVWMIYCYHHTFNKVFNRVTSTQELKGRKEIEAEMGNCNTWNLVRDPLGTALFTLNVSAFGLIAGWLFELARGL